MKVEAAVWYWTTGGMRRISNPGDDTGYIQKGEVERLLTEAHRRGFENGREAAIDSVRSTPLRPG